jgi:hypothetical protein
MTIWETLFGTPERTANTLEYIDQIDVCDFMGDVSKGKLPPEKCRCCLFDYDPYGCEQTDTTIVEWLNQEVTE